jgi:hypothetical protein
VFGAMMVHLQRERGARTDGNALHLEAFTGIDTFVATPRAVYLAVTDMFGALGIFEATDDCLHILGLVLVCHEHGISRLYNDHVLQADGSDEAVLGDE